MQLKPLSWNALGTRFQGLILLLLGIGTGIVAQFALYSSVHRQDIAEYFRVGHWLVDTWNNTSPVLGVSLYLVAGVLFILGVRWLGDRQVGVEIITERRPHAGPKFGFWLSSLGLAGLIAFSIAQGQQDDPWGYALAGLWLFSILLFGVSVLLDQNWRPPAREATREWLVKHRAEILIVAIMLIAAFFIRFMDLEAHPYSFINDEGQLGTIGLCILHGTCKNFFALEGWSGQPYLTFIPYTISIAMLGKTALAMRIVSVITGTLAVAALYLFAREAFDKRIAWVAAFLLVALPVQIQFSRLGVDNIIDSLSAPLILWLLLRGIKRGSALCFLSAGIVSGLCLYTYPGSLLAPALGVALLGVFAFQRRGFFRAHGRNLFFFALTIVVVGLPLVGSFANDLDIFMARFRSEGIFQNGAVQNEVSAGGRSAAAIVLTQFARSTLVYIATPASTGFFNSPEPYLIPLAALLFMLGLAWIVWQIKDPRFLVILAWLGAPIILGSTLTNSPPASQRMLMAMPAMVLIVAIGAVQVLQSMRHITLKVGRFIPVLLLGLVIYTGLANLNFYFNDYRIGHFFEDPANEFAYETRNEIMPLRDQGRLYMVTDPVIDYLSFPDFSYFDAEVESHQLDTVTRETLAALPRDKDVLFIATPDYRLSLQQIQQWIPNGTWHEVRRRYESNQTLYYSYKLKKEQLEGFTP